MMWKEKYRVGAVLIDTQHQELFKRVSNFISVVQSPKPWDEKVEEVKETLGFMQEYVVIHFNDEERFQEEIGYPELERHRAIHSQFRGVIQSYANRVAQEGYTQELMQELGGRLMTWLIMHVAGEDQKIGEFLRSQGGGHES